ncbi:hypothetical protein QTP88_013947 [Uroleucon formosanum]
MTELYACAASLESRVLNIGKIFTIQWVASSFRTVYAVWNNYVALHKHFQESSIDNERDGKERSKYLGLNNMLTSKDFVFNIGMLYDVLNELSDLSLQLQKRELGLAKAHTMIDRTVRILDSMIEIHGPKLTQVILANEEMVFKGIQLHIHKSVQKINSRQFFRSISNNLKSRLFTTQSSHVSNAPSNLFKETYDQLLADLNVFDSNAWLDNVNIQGFREFKDTRDENIADLKMLTSAIKSIAIFSSECKRAFSSMNEIVSQKKNTLGSEHISSLMFINAVGPPVEKINTTKWIESWIKKGKRLATEENCPKRIKIAEENSYESLWNLIKD